MSGHSKWATIHRQKEVKDAKKGQVFTKIGNAISIAVRSSGGIADPEKNFKLRLAIEAARGANMPKENVARAIARGSGGAGGVELAEVTYEGYGPGGIAVVVEAVTDNKNRTIAEIKNLFEREGGSLAGPGAVMFQFEKASLITIKKGPNPEEQILAIMDLGGAEDVEEVSDAIEVYTRSGEVALVKERLEKAGFAVSGIEQIYKPRTPVSIADKSAAEKIIRFMENLENQDDVQRVCANFDIDGEILEQVEKTKN